MNQIINETEGPEDGWDNYYNTLGLAIAYAVSMCSATIVVIIQFAAGFPTPLAVFFALGPKFSILFIILPLAGLFHFFYLAMTIEDILGGKRRLRNLLLFTIVVSFPSFYLCLFIYIWWLNYVKV